MIFWPSVLALARKAAWLTARKAVPGGADPRPTMVAAKAATCQELAPATPPPGPRQAGGGGGPGEVRRARLSVPRRGGADRGPRPRQELLPLRGRRAGRGSWR